MASSCCSSNVTPTTILDEIIALSGETKIPKVMKIFFKQQIAEEEAFTKYIHDKISNVKASLTDLLICLCGLKRLELIVVTNQTHASTMLLEVNLVKGRLFPTIVKVLPVVELSIHLFQKIHKIQEHPDFRMVCHFENFLYFVAQQFQEKCNAFQVLNNFLKVQ
ncbi:hypothetical protein Tco_0674050 [Tanacetum coccineum]